MASVWSGPTRMTGSVRYRMSSYCPEKMLYNLLVKFDVWVMLILIKSRSVVKAT